MEIQINNSKIEVENLPWEDFCRKNSSFKVIKLTSRNENLPYDQEQVLVRETTTNTKRLFLGDNSDKLVWIENFDLSIRPILKNSISIDAFHFDFIDRKKEIGLSFYLFNKENKKIIAIYKSLDTLKQFIKVVKLDKNKLVDEQFFNYIKSREMSEPLTEIDKIRIANLNSKFKNKVSSFNLVEDFTKEINKQLEAVVDSLYIYKLLELCSEINK